MFKSAVVGAILIAAPALGQYFQPTYVDQWGAYFLSADNPQACDGTYDADWAESDSLEPFSAYWDRSFRCLDVRGSVHGYLLTRITDTSIDVRMSWNGAISADQAVPDGWNNLIANTWYRLQFDIPRPMRVQVQASVFLDFDAVIEPGHDDGATITTRFGTYNMGMQLHTHDNSDHGNPSFDDEIVLPSGQGALEMMIFEATVQQDTSKHAGDERFQARATFRMDVIPCPGDIDYDNAAGISDLAVLLHNLGSPGDRADGDLNGDQLVDISDLSEMLSLFGSSCSY